MTPILKSIMSDIISSEYTATAIMGEYMATTQMMGYNGFKRLFRYMARDRLEHALCLKNFLADYLKENPEVSISYVSKATNGNGSNSIDTIITSVMSYGQTQLEKLKRAATMSITDNEHLLMGKLEDMICDQEEELACIRRIKDEYTNSKQFNDVSYLSRKDMQLHDKYKCKESKKQNKKY